jgi:hypothetical protein
MIERIKEGSLELENFCLVCHNEIMGNVQDHPLFVGGICKGESCKVSIFNFFSIVRAVHHKLFILKNVYRFREKSFRRVTPLARTTFTYFSFDTSQFFNLKKKTKNIISFKRLLAPFADRQENVLFVTTKAVPGNVI